MSLKLEHDLKRFKEKRQRVQEVIEEQNPVTYQTALHLVSIFDPIIVDLEKLLEREKKKSVEIQIK